MSDHDFLENAKNFLTSQLRERPWAVYLAVLGLLILLATITGDMNGWRR